MWSETRQKVTIAAWLCVTCHESQLFLRPNVELNNREVLGGYRLHANINQKSRVTWFKLNGCNAEIMKGIIALHCNIGHNALPPNYLRKLKTGKWLTLYLGFGPCCQSLCLTFCGNWGGGFLSTARLGQVFHNWHFYNQHPPERWCDVRWWVGGGKVAGGKSKEKCWLKINCLVKDFSKTWWMFMNCNAAERQFSWRIKKGGLKWALVIEARFSDCAIHPSPWSAASNSIIVWHTYLYKKL